jgi:hypothetical protein
MSFTLAGAGANTMEGAVAGQQSQLTWQPAAGSLLTFQYMNESGSHPTGVSDDINGAWAQCGSSGNGAAIWWVLQSVGGTNPIVTRTGDSSDSKFCFAEWVPSSGTPALDTSGFAVATRTATAADTLRLAQLYVYPAATVGTSYTQLGFQTGATAHTLFQYNVGSHSAGSVNVGFNGGANDAADVAAVFKTTGGGGATVARSKGKGLADGSVLLGGLVARSRWFGRGWRVPAIGGLILPEGI